MTPGNELEPPKALVSPASCLQLAKASPDHQSVCVAKRQSEGTLKILEVQFQGAGGVRVSTALMTPPAVLRASSCPVLTLKVFLRFVFEDGNKSVHLITAHCLAGNSQTSPHEALGCSMQINSTQCAN